MIEIVKLLKKFDSNEITESEYAVKAKELNDLIFKEIYTENEDEDKIEVFVFSHKLRALQEALDKSDGEKILYIKIPNCRHLQSLQYHHRLFKEAKDSDVFLSELQKTYDNITNPDLSDANKDFLLNRLIKIFQETEINPEYVIFNIFKHHFYEEFATIILNTNFQFYIQLKRDQKFIDINNYYNSYFFNLINNASEKDYEQIYEVVGDCYLLNGLDMNHLFSRVNEDNIFGFMRFISKNISLYEEGIIHNVNIFAFHALKYGFVDILKKINEYSVVNNFVIMDKFRELVGFHSYKITDHFRKTSYKTPVDYAIASGDVIMAARLLKLGLGSKIDMISFSKRMIDENNSLFVYYLKDLLIENKDDLFFYALENDKIDSAKFLVECDWYISIERIKIILLHSDDELLKIIFSRNYYLIEEVKEALRALPNEAKEIFEQKIIPLYSKDAQKQSIKAAAAHSLPDEGASSDGSDKDSDEEHKAKKRKVKFSSEKEEKFYIKGSPPNKIFNHIAEIDEEDQPDSADATAVNVETHSRHDESGAGSGSASTDDSLDLEEMPELAPIVQLRSATIDGIGHIYQDDNQNSWHEGALLVVDIDDEVDSLSDGENDSDDDNILSSAIDTAQLGFTPSSVVVSAQLQMPTFSQTFSFNEPHSDEDDVGLSLDDDSIDALPPRTLSGEIEREDNDSEIS